MFAMLLTASMATPAATPPTLRVDIQHSGDGKVEHYALDRVVVEPLPRLTEIRGGRCGDRQAAVFARLCHGLWRMAHYG
jgi:hypothetical protein